MSLKVWLPLNGDLKNLGTSNAIVTNFSATINTAGKIGSCYSFAKNAYLDVNKEIMQNFNNAVSICFWIKINSWNTNWDTIFQAGKGSTAWTQYHIGILRNSANYLCWTLGDGSTASNANYRTGDITLGEWTHVTCTYSEGKWATYLNGILSNSGTTTIIPNFSNITSIKIGGLAGTYKCDCLMNDFRIYNHALSAAEVKEISQGLVLHYKLDTHYLKSGTNLVTDVTKGGQTTKLTDGRLGVITSGVNADTYFTINLSESIVSGTTYHFSCDASGISNGQYWNFPLGAQNNTSLPCKIYNGHNEFVFTANNIDWGTNRLFMDDLNRTDWANPATFYNFVLTKDATYEVKDSSGYNNNGIITGTTTIAEDSPRYPFAISMNNTSTTNHIESINDITLSDNISVSFWVKASKSTSQVIFSTKNIQFGILNSLGYVLPSSAAGYQLTDFVTNSWNHICVVKNAGTFTLYVNGNKPARSGSNNYYVHNVDKLWLFNRSYNSSYGANASISDFRFYATPLLDNDVISLYNVGMKIDNLSNVHAFEFDEEDKNVLAGIPWTSPYSTHSTTQNLFTNYNSNGEPQFTANSTGAGSKYIEITPGVYYYDTTISVNAGNQFYIGFERYDADKTSRSNQACVYIYGTKPSSDVVKQRYKGTVDLSTDSVNPLKYITLRVLNGWSGTNSGVTGQATIHHLSLRLISSAQNPKLEKTGQLITSELKEMGKSSLYQNKLVEAAEFIER